MCKTKTKLLHDDCSRAFLATKKKNYKQKVCEFFILATLDFYLIYYCVHVFCQLPPRTAAALSMVKKNKTFMAALAVKNKTNPDPRAYPLIIAVIS